MPGYVVHIACASEKLRNDPLALIGLIAPDLWKRHMPTEDDHRRLFRAMPGAPSYEEVQLLCADTHGGTHFGKKAGVTNHANLSLYASLLASGHLDVEHPFYVGYLHHLRTDIDFYADPTICNGEAFARDAAKDGDEQATLDRLHGDWDKTNRHVLDRYPEVAACMPALPPDVRALIGFAEGDPSYIVPGKLFAFIERMRQLDDFDALLNAETLKQQQ